MSVPDLDAWIPAPTAPALIYVGTDGERCRIDDDQLDVQLIAPRERALASALLEHSLNRLRDAEPHPTHNEQE